ncbi:hypothetical protein ACFL21_04775 [Patescibacteria group bacterium]
MPQEIPFIDFEAITTQSTNPDEVLAAIDVAVNEQVGLILEFVSENTRRLIVEVGSYGIPAAFSAERGIDDDEYYLDVSKIYFSPAMSYRPALYKCDAFFVAKQYRDYPNFCSLPADCTSFPFPDENVDELIYNNVFGAYYKEPDVMSAFLTDAARVLVDGGKIHITEITTPDYIPDEWFVGGRPNRNTPDAVTANQELFELFGFRVVKLSTSHKDISFYRRPFDGCDSFHDTAFTLTLERIPRN